MHDIDFPELYPKVVLGVAAHPDDLDFGASGTMAKFAAAGADVHYLILTDGGKGTSDPSLTSAELTKIRCDEQKAALKAIGGKSAEFLDYPDGELDVTMKLKRDIVCTIRKLKPDVVITMDPTMVYYAPRGFINHPDHRAAGQATLDAVYPLARDHKSFPDICEEGHSPHKTATILLINFGEQNYHVDITETIDQKMSAIAAHKSQIADINATQTMLRDVASGNGQTAGYTYAESFVRIDIQP